MIQFEKRYQEILLSENKFSKGLKALGLASALTLAGANEVKSQTNIKPLPQELLWAINQVEAGGLHNNVPDGDNGKAKGPFQIHKSYWIDAVKYDPSLKYFKGRRAVWNDVKNYNYAVTVVNAYMNRYLKDHIGATLFSTNIDKIALKHNGGGDPEYVQKIRNLLNYYIKHQNK